MDNYAEWGFGSPEKEIDLLSPNSDSKKDDFKKSTRLGKKVLMMEREVHSEKNNDSGVENKNAHCDVNNSQKMSPHLQQWNWTMTNFGITKEPIDLRRQDLLNKEFQTWEDAEKFFNYYAKCIGFSVRKGHKRLNSGGELVMREWLCSREGSRRREYMLRKDRIREPKAITRVGCKVSFRVVQSRRSHKWIVKEFVTEHSHKTTLCSHIQFLRSNRNVGGGAFMTARSMRGAGIRTCHIMSYIAEISGGYDKVPFIRQDLYNRIGSYETVELADADASRAMGYLHHKADHDARFYGKYSFDEFNRLKNVVWADSRCQDDYCCFGHALAFDTTYKTNSYGKPLLVFVGINHHFKTVIFGFGLMVDETIESYRWVIESFLECMKGIQPETVITDGDNAIAAAVRDLMPNVKHRLCTWHIKQNGIKNVLDGGFNARLQRLMFRYYTDEQFDVEWVAMIKDFALTQNDWASRLYARRKQWAETYLRDSFFGGMTTTQRCESMNSMLKKNVEERMKLLEFVRRIDIALSSLRHTESKDDYDTLNTTAVLGSTNMRTVEEQASKIYSRAMFFQVRDEIKREGKYMVRSTIDHDSVITCKLSKYCQKLKIRRVEHNRRSHHFSCECNLFPTKGIPCRHIFAAMKFLHIDEIPDSLILNRWTMDAKAVIVMNQTYAPTCKYTCAQESARFGHISNRAAELSFYGARNDEIFKLANKILDDGIAQVHSVWEGYAEDVRKECSTISPNINVRNPVFTRTKGARQHKGQVSGGKKKCGICNKIGHNRTTCKRRKNKKKSTLGKTPLSRPVSDATDVNLEDDTQTWFHEEDEICRKACMNLVTPSESATTGMFASGSNMGTKDMKFGVSENERSMSDYDIEDYSMNVSEEEDWWGTPEK